MKATSEDYKSAFDAYRKDFGELSAMADRVSKWYSELQSGKRKPNATAHKAELKTIGAQFDKIKESMVQTRELFNAKWDGLNESTVQSFRGLVACKIGGPLLPGVGDRLLLDECKDFEKAKGDYPERQRLHDSVCRIAESLAASLAPAESDISAEQLEIYEAFETIVLEGDDDARTEFYARNKAAILAVEQTRRLRRLEAQRTEQESESNEERP